MLAWWSGTTQIAAIVIVALVLSRLVHTASPRLFRRSARRAATSPRGSGLSARRRSPAGRSTELDPRLLQRADGIGRLLAGALSVLIVAVAAAMVIERLGIDLVVVISSAGFLGVALAFGGQRSIHDLVAGARALLEDRYAIGDDVVVRVAGIDVRGTVDRIGSASLHLRLVDGSEWHAGHGAVECTTNYSQMPATSVIELPQEAWDEVDPGTAAVRLAAASNDLGLTGVVFVGEIEPDADPVHREQHGQVNVRVNANRPLTEVQKQIVRDRLIGKPGGIRSAGRQGR